MWIDLEHWNRYSFEDKLAALHENNVIELDFTIDGLMYSLRPWYEPWRGEGERQWGLTLWLDGVHEDFGGEAVEGIIFGFEGWSEAIYNWSHVPNDPEGVFGLVDEFVARPWVLKEIAREHSEPWLVGLRVYTALKAA